jgi:alpha-1,3-rhamnosyltransferase
MWSGLIIGTHYSECSGIGKNYVNQKRFDCKQEICWSDVQMHNDTLNNGSGMGPLVSIVIPSYNHADFVRQSILSVINQSYRNIELIVIDDGSRDASQTIIAELKEDYDFQFVTRENQGLSATLNEGVNLATGKYICFLASDDYYLPSRICSAVPVLEKSGEKVFAAYCDGYIVNETGRTVSLFSEKYIRPIVGGIYYNLIAGNWLPAMGMTYKLSVLRTFMFDDKYQIEDHSLYLKMFAEKGANLIALPACGFAYRVHASNFSVNRDVVNAQHALIIDGFPDMKSYRDFKQGIREFGRFPRGSINVRNIIIIFLELIRILQSRGQITRC